MVLQQDQSYSLEVKALILIEYSGMMIVKSLSLMLAQEIWFWDVSMVSMQLFLLMAKQVLEKHIQWELPTR